MVKSVMYVVSKAYIQVSEQIAGCSQQLKGLLSPLEPVLP